LNKGIYLLTYNQVTCTPINSRIQDDNDKIIKLMISDSLLSIYNITF